MKGRKRPMQGCETREEWLRRVLRTGDIAEWRRVKALTA